MYLVIEERRREQYVKEVTSGILDIKPEDNEKEKKKEEQEAVNQHHHNGSNNSNSNNNNQSWFTRPRDKNGRFTSSSSTAADTITVGATAITISTQAATATKPPSWQNKLRDSRGRFVASIAAPSAT